MKRFFSERYFWKDIDRKNTETTLISNADWLLLSLELCSCVFYGVGLCVLFEVGLGITVDSEIGKDGLVWTGFCLSDISHLDGFLSELPFVPTIIGIDIFFDEMNWCFYSLIDHQLIFYSSLNCLGDEAQSQLNLNKILHSWKLPPSSKNEWAQDFFYKHP